MSSRFEEAWPPTAAASNDLPRGQSNCPIRGLRQVSRYGDHDPANEPDCSRRDVIDPPSQDAERMGTARVICLAQMRRRHAAYNVAYGGRNAPLRYSRRPESVPPRARLTAPPKRGRNPGRREMERLLKSFGPACGLRRWTCIAFRLTSVAVVLTVAATVRPAVAADQCTALQARYRAALGGAGRDVTNTAADRSLRHCGVRRRRLQTRQRGVQPANREDPQESHHRGGRRRADMWN